MAAGMCAPGICSLLRLGLVLLLRLPRLPRLLWLLQPLEKRRRGLRRPPALLPSLSLPPLEPGPIEPAVVPPSPLPPASPPLLPPPPLLMALAAAAAAAFLVRTACVLLRWELRRIISGDHGISSSDRGSSGEMESGETAGSDSRSPASHAESVECRIRSVGGMGSGGGSGSACGTA